MSMYNSIFTAEAVIYSATMQVVVSGSEGNRTVTCPDTEVGEGLKKVRLDWEIVNNTEDGSEWEVIAVHGLFHPEFTNKSRDGHDYKCIDKNKKKKDYKYTVVVGSTTTAEVASLDPTIRNGGVK